MLIHWLPLFGRRRLYPRWNQPWLVVFDAHTNRNNIICFGRSIQSFDTNMFSVTSESWRKSNINRIACGLFNHALKNKRANTTTTTTTKSDWMKRSKKKTELCMRAKYDYILFIVPAKCQMCEVQRIVTLKCVYFPIRLTPPPPLCMYISCCVHYRVFAFTT